MDSKPLLIVAAAGLALWWISNRRQAPAASAAPGARKPITDPGRTTLTTTYANPQTMAELLARTVTQTLTGVLPSLPQIAAASAGQGIGTADARSALRASDATYYGWTGPVVSAADPAALAAYSGDPYHGGDMVDSTPAGPVYDPSQFWLNPVST